MKVLVATILVFVLDNRVLVCSRPNYTRGNTCQNGIHYPDPSNCGAYFLCSNGALISNICPSGLNFNSTLHVCDWPWSTPCNATQPPTGQPTNVPPETAVPTAPPASTASTSAPVTTTTEKPYQSCPAIDPEFDVFFPSPHCHRYYVCSDGVPYEQRCPADLHFNKHLIACDYPEYANCTENEAPILPDAVTLPPVIPTATPAAYDEDDDDTPRVISLQTCPAVDPQFDVFLPHPDCTKYYLCFNGIPFEQACPAGLHWNEKDSICDYKEDANCVPNEAPGQPNAVTLAPNPGTTETPSLSSTSQLPTGTPPQYQKCPSVDPEYDVFLPHPDCTRFYLCFDSRPFEQSCPGGLHWNNELLNCDYPVDANCVPNAAPEQPDAVTMVPPTVPPTIPPTVPSTAQTTVPPTAPPPTTSTGRPPLFESCPTENTSFEVFLPHPDCTKYYVCAEGIPIERPCPGGLEWNQAIMVCDFPASANCIPNAAPEQPNDIVN